MSNIKHVIFDIDGVLVDSKEANHISMEVTMKKFGFAPVTDIFIDAPIPTTAKLKFLEESQGITLTPEQRVKFLRWKFNMLKYYREFIEYNEHTIPVITKLLERGITVSYVSNARVDYILMILDHFNLGHTGQLVIGNDSGLKNKPSTEAFEYIAAMVNLPRNEILVVDDFHPTLNAAAVAGFETYNVTQLNNLKYLSL
jgi:phosphoglycolate phosphatase-like HAD superfamily hydrolase